MKYNQPTDKEIVEGLKNNDQRIQAYLFDKYYSFLVFYATKITHDKAEAEDIVVKLFAEVFNGREDFETEQNIKSHLSVSTRNKSFSFLKSHQRMKQYYQEYAERKGPAGFTGNLIVEEERAELMRLMWEVISSMPEKRRYVIALTLNGMSDQEIGRLLNMSPSTVRTHRADARETIKKVLEKYPRFLFFFSMLLACYDN